MSLSSYSACPAPWVWPGRAQTQRDSRALRGRWVNVLITDRFTLKRSPVLNDISVMFKIDLREESAPDEDLDRAENTVCEKLSLALFFP